MRTALAIALMVLAQGAVVDIAVLTVDGNSLSSEYCLLGCDMQEAYVGWDSSVSFTDDDICTLTYTDVDGSACDLVLSFRSEIDLTGYGLEMVLVGGSRERSLYGTFVGGFCTLTAAGVESGESLTISASIPGVRGLDLDVIITAYPDGSDCKAQWSL